ncbi:MAG TPA: 3-deoxy-manno-octulosonate cytidylyltransferase [Vicinamibacteria bacterium]|jgi:3-deoxy-manno-octulosonate cytidylyltransferase (CMP-KDO synthetase)
MRNIAVIPARFGSQRLPGKPLAKIGERTLVEHVYRRTAQARRVDRVLVATDDSRIHAAVTAFGGECVMTSPDHRSGTDRVAEAVAGLEVDIVVNVQGDEPFMEAQTIDQAIGACEEHQGTIATLAGPITTAEEFWDPNVVKVVMDRRGFALYFSRWPIPFMAGPEMSAAEIRRLSERAATPTAGSCLKHLGLYVYPKSLLLELARSEPTPLECQERLEQLRALECGLPIYVELTEAAGMAVDTPADLERARQLFARTRSATTRTV